MAYSDFTFADVKQKFGLRTDEDSWRLESTPVLQPSAAFTEVLSRTLRLGLTLRNEKARSEFIIAPILAELKHLFSKDIALFSGVDFNVDASKGLVGTADFLITRGSEQFIVENAILMIVEAKREDLFMGLGQCIAEMIAARIFNEQAKQDIPVIYGAVTTGSLWKFLKLEGQVVSIDLNEYGSGQVDKILGILASMVVPHKASALLASLESSSH